MAKKKQEEPIVPSEPVQDPFYTIDDKNFMVGIWKVAAPTTMQAERVLELYRKFVNPNQPYFRSCGACDGTYSKIFALLREWYGKNSHKFPSE